MKTKFKILFLFAIITGFNITAQTYKSNDKVSIEENGKWYPGYIMEVNGEKYKIHYDGYDPKYDTWVTTARLKSLGGSSQVTTSSANKASANGTYNTGDIVEYLYRDTWVEAEITSPISSAGRYQVHFSGSLYEYAYPKELRPTNKPSANIEREKLAEQKKKDDEAKAKKDSEDAVGVIEGELYKQFMADVAFADAAVGELCYYLD
ncbi:MAG: hypothetical protein ABIP51_19875, partial [Bacteroidia bacterium]